MKKTILILIVLALIASGCGNKKTTGDEEKTSHLTIDDIDKDQIARFMKMEIDDIVKLLGDKYEIGQTGAEGLVQSYQYKELGLAFAEDGWIEPVLLKAEFNDDGDWIHNVSPKLFEIYGLNPAMNFNQIEKVLGKGERNDGWIETPDHPVYNLDFKIDSEGNYCYTLRFTSFSKDGAYPRISCIRLDYGEKKAEDLVSADEVIIEKIFGDLNGDGEEDVVLLTKKEQKKKKLGTTSKSKNSLNYMI